MTNEAEKIAESMTAEKIAGSIQIEEMVAILHIVAQKIEAQDTGEVTKRGGGRTKICP